MTTLVLASFLVVAGLAVGRFVRLRQQREHFLLTPRKPVNVIRMGFGPNRSI
ncbi:hypothetical protein [Hydrocarboniphaga effusa]|jgi:hypothetical protein|uniref:hypothetical protein n=1 Tax=Hydrocarboniphaga effusa TaxID=243629 RepID=UPI003137A23D